LSTSLISLYGKENRYGYLNIVFRFLLGTKESTYYTVATGNSDTKVLPANTDTITPAVCQSEILTYW